MHTDAEHAPIRSLARACGFDAVGVVALGEEGDGAAGRASRALQRWLARGWHGQMGWMARPQRGSPRLLWPEARTGIVLARAYPPPAPAPVPAGAGPRGRVAAYACRQDYHDVLKPDLQALAGLLDAQTGGTSRIFCDTAALMEKPLAQQAGLGWIGHHTNLVSRSLGSWFLLGVVLSSARIAPDPPSGFHCGSCRRCIDACPTGAIRAPGQLDARRCISYLTIEHRGDIPHALRPLIGDHIFGCDDCLVVCPWNRFAQHSRTLQDAAPTPGWVGMALEDWLGLDEAGFRRLTRGTPLRRTGWVRMQRNCLIAAGNSFSDSGPGGKARGVTDCGHRLADAIRARLQAGDPVIRHAAIWAYGRAARATGRTQEWHRLMEQAQAAPDTTAQERHEWRLGAV